MSDKQTNKDTLRGRVFASVVYPESAPQNWIQILEEQHIPTFISPLHDKDINATGEPKKPHYHVMIMFEGKKSLKQATDVFNLVNGVGCLSVADKRGMARYFTHKDNPDKAQYKDDDVIALSGADYNFVCGVVVDKYRVIGEMLEFIEANRIYSYWEFLIYAKENNQEWFRVLCDNGTYIIEKAIKSLDWTDNRD